ncbi:MAG: TlpA family protein disulfide reductase [Clostridiaceae bacterium]|nr:TlpA family protein disulfide reductase [Clostridiaceae bacterium]
MPQLDEFHQQNKEDIVILTINIGEDVDTVKEFMEEGNYEVAVLMDHDLKVGMGYQIMYTPTTIFIDKEGIIRERQ